MQETSNVTTADCQPAAFEFEFTYHGDDGLPPWLQREMDDGPGADGLHPFASKISAGLRHYVDREQGIELLINLLVKYGRAEGEARGEAKRLARRWNDSSITASHTTVDPKVNIDRIRSIVASSRATLADLKNKSPETVDEHDDDASDRIVDLLFPDRDIIWISNTGKQGASFPHSTFQFRLSDVPFIAPNPMRVAGEYKYDKVNQCAAFSPRCKDNVLYRRWLITEWDIKRFPKGDESKPLTFWAPLIAEWAAQGISTQDAQVRLIAEMYGREFPLGLVVFSGNGTGAHCSNCLTPILRNSREWADAKRCIPWRTFSSHYETRPRG